MQGPSTGANRSSAWRKVLAPGGTSREQAGEDFELFEEEGDTDHDMKSQPEELTDILCLRTNLGPLSQACLLSAFRWMPTSA